MNAAHRLHKCRNENKIIFIYGENIKLQNKGEKEREKNAIRFVRSPCQLQSTASPVSSSSSSHRLNTHSLSHNGKDRTSPIGWLICHPLAVMFDLFVFVFSSSVLVSCLLCCRIRWRWWRRWATYVVTNIYGEMTNFQSFMTLFRCQPKRPQMSSAIELFY